MYVELACTAVMDEQDAVILAKALSIVSNYICGDLDDDEAVEELDKLVVMFRSDGILRENPVTKAVNLFGNSKKITIIGEQKL